MSKEDPHLVSPGKGWMLWPRDRGRRAEERVFLWRTAGGRTLRLASNYPYEIWLDRVFAGDGGVRCAPGEALLDEWDTSQAREVWIRLHYLNARRCSVWYRCLFDDPFLLDLDYHHWQCFEDKSLLFAAKMTRRLPRQNLLLAAPIPGAPLPIELVHSQRQWNVYRRGVAAAQYLPVPFDVKQTYSLEARGPGPFAPTKVDNVVLYVRDRTPPGLCCTSIDLGQIALHRVEVTTTGPVALCYGEVPGFQETWGSASRFNVHLADAVAAGAVGAAPVGTRGCRHVHVVHRAGESFTLQAWRREYPLRWKAAPTADAQNRCILDACRRNLVACVDGGVVDTCWRERTQWVGDLRMSALALRALADNPEVVRHALRQIATSYEEGRAMVQGAWPVKTPGFRDQFMPTYHLAFCLAVLEQDISDPIMLDIVQQSMRAWHRKYVRKGLLRDLPGWHFTDWDPVNEDAAQKKVRGAHAVANCWYYEVCARLGLPSIDLQRFDTTFWMEAVGAYRLLEGGGPSPHATAAALTSLPITKGLGYLRDVQQVSRRVSPYFAYFVAAAFGKFSPQEMVAFIQQYYGPLARQHGTICEKVADTASLAHSWSVGIAWLLASAGSDVGKAPEVTSFQGGAVPQLDTSAPGLGSSPSFATTPAS
jgi:hypothetical protein